MYIHVNNYCYARCEHCCFDWPVSGENMSPAVFNATVDFVFCHASMVTLGGGEPLTHPRIADMVLKLMAFSQEILIITSGRPAYRALGLLRLCNDNFSIRLSHDRYHPEAPPEVLDAFTRHRRLHTYSEIMIAGRGEELRGSTNLQSANDCACAETMIKVNGDIHVCGCEHSPVIGNVKDPDLNFDLETLRDEDGEYLCYKQNPLFRKYYAKCLAEEGLELADVL